MSELGGDGAARGKGEFPARWVDDDGNERDQDGKLIDQYLGEAAYYALEFGGRGAALDFWQQIARGERGAEIDAFIELVALRLVEADRSKGSARRDEIVKAVGLAGQGHVDAVLRTEKRKSTKLRDDRIAELLQHRLTEREIWRKLADERLFEPAPAEVGRQAVPPRLRKAIFEARRSQEARNREMVRGFDNLDDQS